MTLEIQWRRCKVTGLKQVVFRGSVLVGSKSPKNAFVSFAQSVEVGAWHGDC